MTGKMKLYIGLLVPGLALVAGGLWFIFNPPTADNTDSPVGCQWWAVSINGSEVIDHTTVSLYLHNDGSVWGHSGCNENYGHYSVDSTSINMYVGRTMMRCDEEIMKQEHTYLDCIRNTASYSVNGTIMEFYDASKHTLLVFERRPEYLMNPDDLIGTSWHLFSVDGEQVGEEEWGTLTFDEDGVSLHGLDRTTTYEYSYEADGDGIVFTSISVRTIRKPSGEFVFGPPSAIDYISPVVNYRLIDDRLEMYTERRITLTFKPCQPSSQKASWVKGYKSIDELCADEEIGVIAVGKILGIVEVVEKKKYMYTTRFAFRIETLLKGEESQEIIVNQLGKPDRSGLEFGDNPPLDVGERCLLFLYESENNSYYLLGPWGRYHIIDNKVYSLNHILEDEKAYQAPVELDFDGVGLNPLIEDISRILDGG